MLHKEEYEPKDFSNVNDRFLALKTFSIVSLAKQVSQP